MKLGRALAHPFPGTIGGATRLSTLVAVALLFAVVLPTSAVRADPSLAQVEREIAVLTDQMQLATEQYNEARVLMEASQARVAALEPRAKELRTQLDAYERKLSSIATMAYTGRRHDVFLAMLGSGSPQEFLDQSALLEQITVQQHSEIEGLLATKQEFDAAKSKVDAELVKQAANEKLLRDKRSAINRDLAKAQQLADRLGAPKNVVISQYSGPATGKALIALHYAYRQQGKMYEFGASGPNRFDCSGLTKASYAAAGISMPHSAKQQYAKFPKVPLADLRPGDLVMYGSPIRHVAMFVGEGNVIHASTFNKPIEIVPLSRGGGKIAGAVRPY